MIRTPDQILTEYLQEQKAQTPPQQEQTEEPKSSQPVEQVSEQATDNVEAKTEEPTQQTTEAPTVEIDDWDKEAEVTKPPVTEVVNDTPKPVESKPEPVAPKEDVLEGLPDNLKKAIDVAKKGGDYLELLKINSVDYSKINPIQIFESQVYSNAATPEEAKEYLDGLSDVQKRIEGKRLQTQYVAYQQQQEKELLARIEMEEQRKVERKRQADERLKATLDKVDEIAGLKVKTHHKSDIFDAITTGRMQRELFFDQKTGDYDYNGMIETYFLKKNLPKIVSHLKRVTETATKRQVFQEMTNAQIDTPTEKPSPEVDNRTPIEKYVDSFKPKQRKGL